MAYSVEDIDKILGFTSKTDIEHTKKQSRKLYRAIKSIDKYWGGMMLRETQ